VIEPAIALWRIAHAQEALSALIEALASLPHWSWRMDAAIGLRECRRQQAAQALRQALSDEHNLVRSHATDSLLIIHGLSPKDHPLAHEMMSDDSQKREAAMTCILALIENRSLPNCEGGSE
jgi:HEAT repeat protein